MLSMIGHTGVQGRGANHPKFTNKMDEQPSDAHQEHQEYQEHHEE